MRHERASPTSLQTSTAVNQGLIAALRGMMCEELGAHSRICQSMTCKVRSVKNLGQRGAHEALDFQPHFDQKLYVEQRGGTTLVRLFRPGLGSLSAK